mgnify:CR=1 FL=1
MIKERNVDWADTNLALFGSDIEKKCKEAAADGEPQWKGAGAKVGLQVWRIEQFRVRPWPAKKCDMMASPRRPASPHRTNAGWLSRHIWFTLRPA